MKIQYNLLILTVIGISVNVIQQFAGYLLNRRKCSTDKAFGILNIGSYNIGAFGMPYISSFIGSKSIIYASFFDIGNSIGAAGIGYGWGMSVAKENESTTIGSFVKNMFLSPVFDTYLFLLIMRLIDFSLPEQIITFTSIVGSSNTFLAMLMIGIGLELRLSRNKFRQAFKYLGIRYCFAISFSLAFAFFLPFSQEVKAVLCMLLFSPIAAMTSGFTSDAGGDVETSTFMTSVSIIVGIVVMPLILIIMG